MTILAANQPIINNVNHIYITQSSEDGPSQPDDYSEQYFCDVDKPSNIEINFTPKMEPPLETFSRANQSETQQDKLPETVIKEIKKNKDKNKEVAFISSKDIDL